MKRSLRSVLLSTAALGIAVLPLGAAEAQEAPTPFDNSGLYFGAYVGGASDSFTFDLGLDPTVTGLVGGGMVGYRFHRSPGRTLSAAVEAEFGFADINGGQRCNSAPDLSADVAFCVVQVDAAPTVTDYSQDSVARFRALFGAPQGNAEPFVAIGLAIAHVSATALIDPSGTLFGVTVGAGANLAVSPNFYLRPEVLYDYYPSKSIGALDVGLQTVTARIAAIFKLPP